VFDIPSPPPLPTLDIPDLPKPLRRVAVDSYVREQRKVLPTETASQRAVQRLSVSEMNALDMDAIRQRFDRTRVDTRGPVTRFLDLLDVPRNFIASRILAPSIRKKKELEGETGTFGEGKVYVSDILENMGVENRVVRGVAGFLGDLAIDPLTYVGGAPFKALSAGARTGIQATKAGFRGLSEAEAALRAGRQIADPLVARFANAYKVKTAEELAGLVRGKAGNLPLTSVLDDEGGSRLARDVLDVVGPQTPVDRAEQIAASKAWFERYGRHNAPGVRVGRANGSLAVEASLDPGRVWAGTGYLHLPFTDIGVYGPAITGPARSGIAAGKMAQAVSTAFNAAQGVTPELQNFIRAGDDINDLYKSIADSESVIRDLDNPTGAWTQNPAIAPAFERGLQVQKIKNLREAQDAAMSNLRTAYQQAVAPKALTKTDELLHASKMYRAHLANAARIGVDAERQTAELANLRKLYDDFNVELDRNIAAKSIGQPPAAIPAIVQSERAALVQKVKAAFPEAETLTKEGMDARQAVVDAFHAKQEANQTLADVMGVPVRNTMQGGEKALADVAQELLGEGFQNMPHLFSPIKAVADGMFADQSVLTNNAPKAYALQSGLNKAEGFLRRTLGYRSGEAHEVQRMLHRATNLSGPEAVKAVASISQDLRDAGVAPENVEEAGRLLMALLYEGSSAPPAASSKVWSVLQDAKQSGILNQATNPGLYQKLQALAAKYRVTFQDWLAQDIQNGLLPAGTGIEDYDPRITTVMGDRAIAESRANVAKMQTRGASGGVPTNEAFQRARTTDRYNFTTTEVDPATGQAVTKDRFFSPGHLVYTTYSPDQLERLSPQARAYVEARADDVRAWDKLPFSDRVNIKPERMSVFDFESDVMSHGIHAMTGGAPLFETNLLVAMTKAGAARDRAHALELMQRWAAAHGINAQGMELRGQLSKVPNGAIVDLPGGVKARVHRDPSSKMWKYWIGDQAYRAPDPSSSWGAKYDPTMGIKGYGVYERIYPEHIAEQIEKFGRTFSTDQDVHSIVKAIEETTKFWKATTLLHPSWTINDIIGSTILAVNMGVNPAKLAKYIPAAFKAVRAHMAGDLAGLAKTFDHAGIQRPLSDAISDGVQGNSGAFEAIGHMAKNGVILPSVYNLTTNPIKAAKEMHANAIKALQTEANGVAATAGSIARQKPAQYLKGLVYDDAFMRRLWAPWVKANGLANDTIRTAAYMALLESEDSASAARRIADNMFDMSTLTATEEKLRKFLPFYSWIRASGAYGVGQLLQNPKFFTVAPHAKRAIEHAINGENTLPQHMRPSWLRDQLAIQIGDDAANRQMVLFSQMLPNEAAIYLGTLLGSPALGQAAVQDGIAYFGNALTPLLKAPLEITAGREFFTKREIASEGGDLTPSEYLLGQVRPLRELGVGQLRTGPVSRAFAQGPAQGLSRLVIGGRVQPADDERLAFSLQREYEPRVNGLRKRINLAEREGNKEASLAARVKLLKLFEEMQAKGVKIPKWAESQIGQVTGVP